jgi:hypothetical protein
MKSMEGRQTTQLSRDGPCQLIIIYKTVEETHCETDLKNGIVFNSDGGRLTNIKLFEACQSTQLGRNWS